MSPRQRLRMVLELMDQLRRPEGAAADDRMRRFFRDRREAGSHDRRWIVETAYTLLRHHRRVQWRVGRWIEAAGLGESGERGGMPRRARDLAALVLLAGEHRLPEDRAQMESLVLDPAGEGRRYAALARALMRAPDPPLDPGTDTIGAFAVTAGLPGWAAARLWQQRGREDAVALGAAMLEMAPVDLRVNVLKADREGVRRRLSEESDASTSPTPWSPWGLRLGERQRVQDGATFRDGLFELQDEGSQLVTLATGAGPGDRVIDAAAGGGGKTLALAAMMANRGRIWALDPNRKRLEGVRSRLGRAGISNVTIRSIDPRGDLPPEVPRDADLVLIDAPCSGSGTWRRSPDLKIRYGERDVARLASTQLRIVQRFAARVRPGGLLVYVTCSLFEEENERVIDRFLKTAPGWEIEPPRPLAEVIPADRWRTPEGYVRLDPVRTGTDGFFLASLRRDHVGS